MVEESEVSAEPGGRVFRITAALVVVLVAAVVLIWLRQGSLVGGSAPDFTLPDLQGNMVRLRNLRGKVVFINVWATWCPPCREEMPALERLYQHVRSPSFEMLAISVDHDRKAVEDFVREQKLSFPILLDPDMTVTDPYEITGYPESFVIDRNGVVLTHEIGPAEWDQPRYERPILELIKGGKWLGFE